MVTFRPVAISELFLSGFQIPDFSFQTSVQEQKGMDPLKTSDPF